MTERITSRLLSVLFSSVIIMYFFSIFLFPSMDCDPSDSSTSNFYSRITKKKNKQFES